MVNCDFLIRNANVFDGTGAEGQMLDVAIRDGRISAIGPSLTCRAARSSMPKDSPSRRALSMFTLTTTPA